MWTSNGIDKDKYFICTCERHLYTRVVFGDKHLPDEDEVKPAIYFSQDLWQEEVVECRTPDRRRCHELPCFSYPMSPQQVGHKPTPAQSTWEHWLCIFLPLPSMHKDLVASGRMVADKGDVTVISKPA